LKLKANRFYLMFVENAILFLTILDIYGTSCRVKVYAV
jgi:hypothetical protein